MGELYARALWSKLQSRHRRPQDQWERFRRNAQRNPWNNGQKGILFLAQQFNTMHALFNLAGECAKKRLDLDPGSVCGQVGSACGPDRNSDPRVCQACQNLARTERGLSLEDPVGIKILQLGGAWELNGQAIDINDAAANQNIWVVTRNGKRGHVTEDALPEWARTGQEGTRM